MKKFRVFIFLFLVMVGCSSVPKNHYDLKKDDFNMLRVVPKKLEKNSSLEYKALRDKDGKIIYDHELAQNTFQELKSEKELSQHTLSHYCWSADVYYSKKLIEQAQEEINKGEFARAQESLNQAKKRCEIIGKSGYYYYFMALTYSRLNQVDQTKKYLHDFLDYAENLGPSNFSNNIELTKEMNESKEKFVKYRDFANDYLNGKRNDLELVEGENHKILSILKFSPNNRFSPGGSDAVRFSFLLPTFVYETTGNTSIGLAYFYYYDRWRVVPQILHHQILGNVYGLKIGNSFYQSENRDLNIEVFYDINSWKKASGLYQVYTNKLNITSTQSGVNHGLGIGLTKRFNPYLGFSEVSFLQKDTMNQRVRFLNSLYGFVNIYGEDNLRLFSGVLENDNLTAGFMFSFIKTGYNFKNKSFYFYFLGDTF